MAKGFTLIELLIVVAIIAILAAIAVPNFLEAQTRAKVSRTKADLRALATALESYTVDGNKPMTTIVFGKNSTMAGSISGPSIINSAFTAPNCCSARFIRLSTPIAYMTNCPPDVFAKDGFGMHPDLSLILLYDTFDYFCGFDFAPPAGGAFDTALGNNWRGAGLSSGAAWRLASAGPDRINRYGGGTADSNLLYNQLGVDYDPTNGTVSRGDIVRISSGAGPINESNPGRKPAIDRIKNVYNVAGL
jgi:prepilin-type N-terminal cleavage/methylation domain-containing protein